MMISPLAGIAMDALLELAAPAVEASREWMIDVGVCFLRSKAFDRCTRESYGLFVIVAQSERASGGGRSDSTHASHTQNPTQSATGGR